MKFVSINQISAIGKAAMGVIGAFVALMHIPQVSAPSSTPESYTRVIEGG